MAQGQQRLVDVLALLLTAAWERGERQEAVGGGVASLSWVPWDYWNICLMVEWSEVCWGYRVLVLYVNVSLPLSALCSVLSCLVCVVRVCATCGIGELGILRPR